MPPGRAARGEQVHVGPARDLPVDGLAHLDQVDRPPRPRPAQPTGRARGGGCPCRRAGRGPRRRRPTRGPRRRRGRRPWPRTGCGSPRRPARATVTVRRPASVAMGTSGPSPGSASSSAWARQRMPLPLISARDPSALRSSIRIGRAVARRRRGGPDEAVGADARVPVAQGARQVGVEGVGGVGVEQDEEVVAQAVVLRETHVGVQSARRRPVCGPVSPTPPAPPAPSSRRRPPPRARPAGWPGRRPRRASGSGDRGGTTTPAAGRSGGCGGRPGRGRRRAARRPPRGTPAPGSPAPGGPCGTGPAGRRAGARPRRGSRRPSAGGTGPRCARRRRRAAGARRPGGSGSAGRRRGPGP